MILGPWFLVPHACRTCGGRIVTNGSGSFACSTCGVRTIGRADGICGCGIAPAGAMPKRGRFRCIENPAQSSENPAAVVILFDGEPAQAQP